MANDSDVGVMYGSDSSYRQLSSRTNIMNKFDADSDWKARVIGGFC